MNTPATVLNAIRSAGFEDIYAKVAEGHPLSFEDGVRLYSSNAITAIGYLANLVRERKHGNQAFYVKNRQLNPTNVCEYNCMFCSFKRDEGEEGAYVMSLGEIRTRIEEAAALGVREIHIVSGLHPNLSFSYYTDMLRLVKEVDPNMHIKAFTAVEIEYYAEIYDMTIEEVLSRFIEAGLDAMPGGGAEIFAQRVRDKICDQKATAEGWLRVHRAAHKLGLVTNATMLYGHIERIEEKVDHLIQLRDLQTDSLAQAKGHFNTFIPLAYQHENNRLKKLPKATAIEDLKNIAIPRLLLHNFPHIKAYWVVIGPELAQIALAYGADEVEGTIIEETIMAMAGTDSSGGMTEHELVKIIERAGRQPVQRDALYNVVGESAA